MAKQGPWPYTAFHFKVELEGSSDSFSEVSGLVASAKLDESYLDEEGRSISLIDKVTTDNLVLKRGIDEDTKGSAFSKWCEETLSKFSANGFGSAGSAELKTLNIHLLNEKGGEVMSWTVYDAFPTKWEISSFNAMESKVATETIELTYRRFEMS